MKAWSILILAAFAAECGAGEDSALAQLRNLAFAMLQRNDLGGATAFCEYAPITQVDGCSGPGRNEFKHVAHPNGLLETWRFRSLGETGRPIGRYRGKMKPGQWRLLLKKISEMHWESGSESVPLSPPGPLESIHNLILSDGRKTASYSLAGIAPKSIETAFYQLEILAQDENDTLWELSLSDLAARIRNDSVAVTARWKWLGPPGVRVLFSGIAGGSFCGSAWFKWFEKISAYSIKQHEEELNSAVLGNPTWKLEPGLSSSFTMVFPYAGSAKQSKRVGQLNGIGIRLVVPGEADTVSATVLSSRFEF